MPTPLELELEQGTIDRVVLSLHKDPILFLQRQYEIILTDTLPKLVNAHRQHLQSGNKLLSQSRSQILTTIAQLNEIVSAMNELYTSEKYATLNKYNTFTTWIDEKSQINNKIAKVKINSNEGKMYLSLSQNLSQIDNDIANLEAQLKILKSKRKLLNTQLQETKSLLDIKLNPLNDELESLSIKEKEEINLLSKENLIPANTTSDIDVSNTLKERIDFFDTIIGTNNTSLENLTNSSTYLSDIFQTLSTMESAIKTFLTEGNIPQIEKSLLTNRTYLKDALTRTKPLNLPPLQSIISNEISAIEKAMKLLNIELPQDDVNLDDFSNDSTDYNYESSTDNIPQVNATKQSLQLQTSTPSSPPGITNTNAIVIPKSSTKKTKFKSDTNKYDLLLSEIKSSKGDKTD